MNWALPLGRIEELMSECVQYSESIVKLDDAAQVRPGASDGYPVWASGHIDVM